MGAPWGQASDIGKTTNADELGACWIDRKGKRYSKQHPPLFATSKVAGSGRRVGTSTTPQASGGPRSWCGACLPPTTLRPSGEGLVLGAQGGGQTSAVSAATWIFLCRRCGRRPRVCMPPFTSFVGGSVRVVAAHGGCGASVPRDARALAWVVAVGLFLGVCRGPRELASPRSPDPAPPACPQPIVRTGFRRSSFSGLLPVCGDTFVVEARFRPTWARSNQTRTSTKHYFGCLLRGRGAEKDDAPHCPVVRHGAAQVVGREDRWPASGSWRQALFLDHAGLDVRIVVMHALWHDAMEGGVRQRGEVVRGVVRHMCVHTLTRERCLAEP